jgi:hypothetical protein
MTGQPITAGRDTVQRDGLVGAIGVGVITNGTETSGDAPTGDVPEGNIGGVPIPSGLPLGAAQIAAPEASSGDPLDPNNRWDGPIGYELWGEPCGAVPYMFDPAFCTPDGTAGHARRNWGAAQPLYGRVTGLHAFGIGAGVKCGTLSSPKEMEPWRAAARRILDLTEWNQIAHELWTGARDIASGYGGGVGANRRLASPAATVLNGGTAVDALEAVAALEDAFGAVSSGYMQLIHVPRKMAAYLWRTQIVTTSPGNGRLYTANDALVIADRSYPGTGPNGEAPSGSTFWIYSTGILTARLGKVRYPEQGDVSYAVRSETNDYEVHAERPAAISWLCAHFAIKVDLALPLGSTNAGALRVT